MMLSVIINVVTFDDSGVILLSLGDNQTTILFAMIFLSRMGFGYVEEDFALIDCISATFASDRPICNKTELIAETVVYRDEPSSFVATGADAFNLIKIIEVGFGTESNVSGSHCLTSLVDTRLLLSSKVPE